MQINCSYKTFPLSILWHNVLKLINKHDENMGIPVNFWYFGKSCNPYLNEDVQANLHIHTDWSGLLRFWKLDTIKSISN